MRDSDANRTGVGGAQVELRALSKSFGAVAAVDNVSLEVAGGSFVSLLGPSGSGKTTTLNLIAGFLALDSGDILFDGRSVAGVPAHKRNIGMVFQSYALFPHLTVAANVAFPLRMRAKLGREETRRRVEEMLALVRLSQLGDRYPRQLSGGQQQRVAMARALVSNPRLLLMDEPLGALDKKLREQLQSEIRRIHRTVGTTFVYVTHDQSEALTLSDAVVVMHKGRIAQIGAPRALYDAPANAFVADFLGDSNLLAVEVIEAAGDRFVVQLADGRRLFAARGAFAGRAGDRAALLIRPEDMRVGEGTAAGPDALAGQIAEIGYHGDAYRLAVAVGAEILTAKVPRAAAAGLAAGGQVVLSWPAGAARLLPPGGEE